MCTNHQKEYYIIIVDDDPLYRHFLVTLLSRQGNIVISEASNPKEAFELIKNKRPNLILLDMEMPFMSGLNVLKYIRENMDTKDIPVIPCTAIRTKELVMSSISLGITDFIEKQTDPNIIIEKILKALHKQ